MNKTFLVTAKEFGDKNFLQLDFQPSRGASALLLEVSLPNDTKKPSQLSLCDGFYMFLLRKEWDSNPR